MERTENHIPDQSECGHGSANETTHHRPAIRHTPPLALSWTDHTLKGPVLTIIPVLEKGNSPLAT